MSPSFLHYLTSILHISDALKLEIERISQTVKVNKGEIIQHSGERCQDLYYVESGTLRGYFLERGREITHSFSLEQEFVTCYYAFIAMKPSYETIHALEDSILIRFSYADLQNLFVQFPETERLGRIITENYYIKLEERLQGLQFKTARERYEQFLLEKPSLLQRASLGQIASYLGMTQETLSRIRAGK